MSVSALVCLAPGSEETEAVTTIDLLVRAGVKVTTASVAGDGELTIVCSRGVKLLADAQHRRRHLRGAGAGAATPRSVPDRQHDRLPGPERPDTGG